MVNSISNPASRNSTNLAACIGVFDGLHSGHKHLIKSTIAAAERLSSQSDMRVQSAIITFNIDPDELFVGSGFTKLMTNEQRLEALSKSGVDKVIVLNFADIANLSPQDFFEIVLTENLPVISLTVGENFRFGNNRNSRSGRTGAAGDAKLLKQLCQQNYIECNIIHLLKENGSPISSSRIRANKSV